MAIQQAQNGAPPASRRLFWRALAGAGAAGRAVAGVLARPSTQSRTRHADLPVPMPRTLARDGFIAPQDRLGVGCFLGSLGASVEPEESASPTRVAPQTRPIPLSHVVAVFIGNGLEFYNFLSY